MHSLAHEIQGFSKSRLKKQSTCVTTATGKRLLETRNDAGEEHLESLDEGCGIVLDHSLDLQVGVVRPFLLLASQDAAHDMETLRTHQLVYKTVQILDLPDTNITAYLEECSSFINQAREQNGVVLVHCNAGVSRSSSIVIGYLMAQEKLSFDRAHSQVQSARPSARPNAGFYRQLLHYKP
ncbi:dual specificity protein phosphatase 19-like isoform X2 [Boleophthalmus pectinirostris]|uniref:dual specificity protein phosphatase 19-like isoform X2 n=1 Tax=Boleophthalmus pectinirostris TaxID=150288 RepID=UPI00242CD488|nr:dual specificity protein phosphatase 19-like isoform X2 [Boleophthalmus pectinirostris]